MTELEKKLLLTRDEYECLSEHFRYNDPHIGKPIRQINYYFDTDNLLMNRQNITCRVRLKDGKYKATMKIHMPNSNCSTEIDMTPPHSISENIFTEMGLKLQGELVTERTLLIKSDEYEVVLDKNQYLGVVDHELEIEYFDGSQCYAEILLQSLIDILQSNVHSNTERVFSDSCKSKSKRFFEKLQKDF